MVSSFRTPDFPRTVPARNARSGAGAAGPGVVAPPRPVAGAPHRRVAIRAASAEESAVRNLRRDLPMATIDDGTRRLRYWGAAAGTVLGIVDTATLWVLGTSFQMNGHDVTLVVAG